MEDIEHLPKELQIKPRCLIALTGLNVETNPFHAYVWKSFSRGQPDNHDALRFINLPLDYPYSKSKPKVDYWSIFITVIVPSIHPTTNGIR